MKNNSSQDLIDINKISLHKAKLEDMMDVFNLANDPEVRKNSFNQKQINLEDHKIWFKDKIRNNRDLLYIFKISQKFIGHVLLKNINNDFLISIYLLKEYRNKGFGKKILDLSIEKLKNINNINFLILAYVNKANIGSLKLFEKSDFIKKINKNIKYKDFILFEKKIIKEERSVVVYSNMIYKKIFKKNNKKFDFIFNKEDLNCENLKKLNPKYIFFVHWSYFIPDYIYNNYNCIIFHMTDLPFGRGGSPLQNLISRGIYKTKISAIKCDKDIDAGDIYLKKNLSLKNGNAYEIYLKSGRIIKKMIEEICKNNTIPKPQNGEVVTFKRREGKLSEIKNLDTIRKIYDQIRMLDCDGYPNAFLILDGFKYSFSNAKLKKNKILASVEINKL